MKIKKRVKIAPLFSLALLAAGLVTSVVLIQQRQNLTSKAVGGCEIYNQAQCGAIGGCVWSQNSCSNLSTGSCPDYPGCSVNTVSVQNCSDLYKTERECAEAQWQTKGLCMLEYVPRVGTCSGSPPCASKECTVNSYYKTCSISTGCNQSGCSYTPAKAAYCKNCPVKTEKLCNNLSNKYGCVWMPATPASCTGKYISSQTCSGFYSYSVFSTCSGSITDEECVGTYYKCSGTPNGFPCCAGSPECNTYNYEQCTYRELDCSWQCNGPSSPTPTKAPTPTPTIKPCSSYVTQSTCPAGQCSWSSLSCSLLSTSICPQYSGCSVSTSTASCSGFSENTCENYLGCTANYTTKTGTCSGSPPCASGCSQKNNYASCSLASGCSQPGCSKSAYCTGLTSNCNGLSQTNCNLYASRYGCEWISTCSGSYYTSTSCVGTYSYETYSSCSGSYVTGKSCTGTYYQCVGARG